MNFSSPHMKTEEGTSSGVPSSVLVNNFDTGHRDGTPDYSYSSSNKSKPSTKRVQKGDANTKAGSGPPAQRFQCPKCPKNFSRIENLTRHQANHEDVGRFACVICRKRFTRSDLLNRHRRIHISQSSVSPPQLKPQGFETHSFHDLAGPSNLQDPRGLMQQSHDNYNPSHRDAVLQRSRDLPEQFNVYNSQIQTQDPNLYINQNQSHAGYQSLVPQDVISSNSSMLPGHVGQAQGLASLMEAALAPQESFAFTPAENFDASLWGGFMLFGDNTNAYMGSYDADISWTLNSFQSEPSPESYLDHNMSPVSFAENPYQYQAISYRQDDVTHLDAADAEDEDTNDWSDKVDRTDNPQPRSARIVALHLLPVSWQTVLEEARTNDLLPTTIQPFQRLSNSLRDTLISALDGPRIRSELSRPEIIDSAFPPLEALDFFLQLYIRYVHPRFSVLHLPTFDVYNTPPLLLAAMMFLGSSHSRADRGRFSRLFYDHLRIAMVRLMEMDHKALRSTDNILTNFLLCLAGTWSGSKQAYEFAEGGRGTLITACRRARLLDCRPQARTPFERFQRPGLRHLDAVWLAWVDTEKRKRLGLSIYVFDCQYPALFNNQPYVSRAETTNCAFPCSEEYWEAPTATTWKNLVGKADGPPSYYYLHALNACLLRKWVNPPPPVSRTGGEFGKMMLIYAIHTHIFEWRQSTSMLNPTGLIGTFGTNALPIGEGLKDRRRWLIDGLDSWGECYHSSNTSIAADLLHSLAYVALDVSLSDMHLVAGRSNNINDGDFALENLKHWANSEMANSTMSHVFHMLDLCHEVLMSEKFPDSSYEVAVCLFTGGIICWAYAKVRVGVRRGVYDERVAQAGRALREMGCWRMCSMFGRVLNSLEVPGC